MSGTGPLRAAGGPEDPGSTASQPTAPWWGTSAVSDEQALRWVAKASSRAAQTLEFAGAVADPAQVLPAKVIASEDWLYGNFMLAWLDADADPRRVRHLPDASFFLQLLRLAYAPVLQRRPDLTALLDDTSRPEMSLTNDVLQIQLRGLTDGYSMIRHHALMLFYAGLWLDEPRRSQWLDLYDELVSHVDQRAEGRPSLERLAEVEAKAFSDFTTLARRTLRPTDAQALLDHPTALDNILQYQLYAGVAIGLVWREYRAIPTPDRQTWQRDQLSWGYLQLDYLKQKWVEPT